MALSIPALLTGGGAGFLVGGPVGAAIGAAAAGILAPRPQVEVVNTPAGPGILVNSEAIYDPTRIPQATQPLDTPLAADAIDYQPYPPRYVWNQSDALAGFGLSTWEQLKASLPLSAIGVVSLGILALMYFAHAPPRR